MPWITKDYLHTKQIRTLARTYSSKVRVVNWQDPEIAAVESREDLARYLMSLAARLREDNLPTENPSTDAFIDAAGRWTKSMDGFFSNVLKEPVPDSPDWSTVAAIFRAALVYE